jgi:hypothetical protein
MDMEDIEKTPKNAPKFYCNWCDFICFKQSDWNRHILRPKHYTNYKMIQNDIKNAEKTPDDECRCKCGKIYKYKSGLWRHRKTCFEVETNNIDINSNSNNGTPQITPELIIELINQNKELQQTLIEQNKTIIDLAQKTGSYHNYVNSNNNNKTFNLQVFLNETCKNAINLSDFVNQIQISIDDLEETGTIGYAEGISKVFLKNLKGIDFTLRPIHCSDSKRETLYIKNDNEWKKDDEQKTHLTKAVKQVANKNIKQITQWQKLHPEYSDPDSKQNDKYMKIVLNSMSGSTKEESDKNYEKIVKNITKEVVIDKKYDN